VREIKYKSTVFTIRLTPKDIKGLKKKMKQLGIDPKQRLKEIEEIEKKAMNEQLWEKHE
jgi:hypothetical protein